MAFLTKFNYTLYILLQNLFKNVLALTPPSAAGARPPAVCSLRAHWCSLRSRFFALCAQTQNFFFTLEITRTDAAFGGWCEACGAKLASLAFEENSNVNETFCEIFKLVWVIGEKEGGMEEDVCVIAKLTSSSTWRWNEIECQSSGHF